LRREEALEQARRIMFSISNLCSRVQIVGSIRRGKPEVHDIDLVVIPKEQPPFYAFTWDAIATRLQKELDMQLIRKGRQLMTLGFRDKDLPVDIYRATPENWGVLVLIRTGSKEHNVKLCKQAQALGLKLSASQGVLKNGKVIASESEEEIFEALGLDYVPPEKREA